MSAADLSGPGRFAFVQVEVAWPLAPPDGRHVLRVAGAEPAPISHVVLLRTIGAPPRRRSGGPRARSRSRAVTGEPAPAGVPVARATTIDVSRPLDDAVAGRWLKDAGEPELADALAVLTRLAQAQRIATADPQARPPTRAQLTAVRFGYGTGDELIGGRWSQARELAEPAAGGSAARRRGRRAHGSDIRLADLLAGRRVALVCEELVLRARADLDAGRPREAALQTLVALDAAIAELSRDPLRETLSQRLADLRGRRDRIGEAAQAALTATPAPEASAAVAETLAEIEAALRARAR